MAAIVVVEDDEYQRIWLREELESDGHSVVCAPSAEEALAIVERAMPDVVVLDLGMPGMDGLDLLGRLLDLNKRLPVVIHSAYASYQDNFMSWAADAYVIKQSDLSELKQAIQQALDSRCGSMSHAAPPEAPQHSTRL